MRRIRLQFGLRALFAVLTVAAVCAWWPKYGRPLYDEWQTPRRFRAALRAGDPKAFVLSLQRLETLLARQPGNQGLLDRDGGLPQPLPVDQGLANECLDLLDSPSAKVRVLAALFVGLMRRNPPSEVRRLAALLSDPSADVRAAAAHVLKCYGANARPAIPDLVKLVNADRSGFDWIAAFDTLLKLDHDAPIEAIRSRRIHWMSLALGLRPSEFADHLLENIDPGYRRNDDDLFERQFVDTELAFWREQLAVAVDQERRDRCQEHIDAALGMQKAMQMDSAIVSGHTSNAE